jgi:hypothetical protein
MDRLFGVILNSPIVISYPVKSLTATNLGEGFDLSTMTGGSLSRKEAKRAVARSFVLKTRIEQSGSQKNQWI